MRYSVVGDHLGGEHQERLQGRAASEVGSCGVHWHVCGWKVLGSWREGKTSGRGKRICKGPEA